MLAIGTLCIGLLTGFVLGWVVRDITCMEMGRGQRIGASATAKVAEEESAPAVATRARSDPTQAGEVRTTKPEAAQAAVSRVPDPQSESAARRTALADEAPEQAHKPIATNVAAVAPPAAKTTAAKSATAKGVPRRSGGAQSAPSRGSAKAHKEPDDLKLISGVGPKLELRLHELGVKTFKDIARFTKADVERIGDALSFRGRIERDNWVKQARTLHQKKYGEKA